MSHDCLSMSLRISHKCSLPVDGEMMEQNVTTMTLLGHTHNYCYGCHSPPIFLWDDVRRDEIAPLYTCNVWTNTCKLILYA